MTISVKNIINSTIAAFHSDGLMVFQTLQKAVKEHQEITISFKGLKHCSTQFLNASIGKLYLMFEATLVDQLLRFDYGALPNLTEKIAEVRENAIDSKEYDSLVENATL